MRTCIVGLNHGHLDRIISSVFASSSASAAKRYERTSPEGDDLVFAPYMACLTGQRFDRVVVVGLGSMVLEAGDMAIEHLASNFRTLLVPGGELVYL